MERCFPGRNEIIRQAAAGFLQALLRSRAEQASLSQEFGNQRQKKDSQVDILSRIVSSTRADSSPIVRTLLADSLPFWDTFLQSASVEAEEYQTRPILSSLLKDGEAAARASAVRALGVILMDSLKLNAKEESEQELRSSLEFSIEALTGTSTGALDDEALLVQTRGSWTLANLCEVYFARRSQLQSPTFSQEIWTSLLRAALSASKKEERVALNALRAFGALLGSIEPSWIPQAASKESLQRLSQEAIERLCDVVWVSTDLQPSKGSSNQGGSPKMKWNAASSLGRALGSEEAREWLSETVEGEDGTLFSKVVLALSSSIHSRTFKVKLASAHALLQVPSTMESFGSKESLQVLRQSCDLAIEKIDDLISNASFSEANLHGEPCRSALKKLKERLG